MNAEQIKSELKELGEYMLNPANVPRHPRGFKGPLEYVDVAIVVRARDPATGRMYVIDPVELEPGEGETPEPDVFARDYATVGTRRGTSLVDILARIVPVITGGGGIGGGSIIDIIGGLFGRRKTNAPR